MAPVDPTVVEMPEDPAVGAMPPYARLGEWAREEIAGFGPAELDVHDDHPDREWMWWSPRRQLSHMAWDALIFSRRRGAHLLWPGGDIPEPIVWADHRMGPDPTFDRILDPSRFHTIEEILPMLDLGLGWLSRIVAEHPVDTLRADVTSVRGTPFWQHVISTLPRGAEPDPEREGYLRYTLEASLWMVFYEVLTHIRTLQRFARVAGRGPRVELPRVGYLRLPEYWGDTDANAPGMTRF